MTTIDRITYTSDSPIATPAKTIELPLADFQKLVSCMADLVAGMEKLNKQVAELKKERATIDPMAEYFKTKPLIPEKYWGAMPTMGTGVVTTIQDDYDLGPR